MRLFKKNGARASWNAQTDKNWMCELRDHYGRVRRLALFTDKKSSYEVGLRLDQLVSAKIAGIAPDVALIRWADSLPVMLKQKLVDLELLDSSRLAIAEPLEKHLEAWRESLLAKGSTKSYVNLVCSRAKRILTECRMVYWPDVTAEKAQRFLSGLHDEGRGAAAQTATFYQRAITQFCRWMRREGRVKDSPLDNLSTPNVRVDRRHDRRALTEDELRRLIETTRTGPTRLGMTGPERALLYTLAVESGLRANELRTLTASSFDLGSQPPTVTVLAAYSKHRREDALPLRPEMAVILKEHLALKLPSAPAFNVPAKTYKMIRADMEVAGIPYVNSRGLYADFHSLRHTFVTNLAKSGVHPRTAQTLARHSDINLTMSVYTHTVLEDQADALKGLPDLTAPKSKEAEKTG